MIYFCQSLGIQVTKIGEFKGHQQSIYSIIQLDSASFLSGGADGFLVKWKFDNPDGELLAQIPEPIFCLAIHPQSGRCAAGTRLGNIYEFRIHNKELIRQWKAHNGAIFQLLYEKDGLLISLSEDGIIKKWLAESNRYTAQNKISERSLRALKTNQNGNYLIGASDGVLSKINPDTFQVESHLQVFDLSLFALETRDQEVFCAGRNAQIGRVNGDKISAPINAHWFTIHTLSINKAANLLASGSMDKTIKLWNPESMELLKVIDRERYGVHGSSVNQIIWVSENQFLTCSDDRLIALFSVE